MNIFADDRVDIYFRSMLFYFTFTNCSNVGRLFLQFKAAVTAKTNDR